MVSISWRKDTNALKFSVVESLQSHMILTMSHWSSGLTCLLPATRVTGSNPLGGLMWNQDSPISDVSLKCQIYSKETSATASIRRRFPLQKLPLQQFASPGSYVLIMLPLQQLVCSSFCLEQFSLYQFAFVVACFKLDLPWRWLLSQFASASVAAQIWSSFPLQTIDWAAACLCHSFLLTDMSLSYPLQQLAFAEKSCSLPLQLFSSAYLS